jgi:hypothetical protein
MTRCLISATALVLLGGATAACSGMDWSTPAAEINPAAAKYSTAPSSGSTIDPATEPGLVGPSDATPATNRDLQQEPGALSRRPGRGGK